MHTYDLETPNAETEILGVQGQTGIYRETPVPQIQNTHNEKDYRCGQRFSC